MRRVCRMDEVKVGPFEVGKLGDPESCVQTTSFSSWGLQALAKRVSSSEVRGSRLYW